MDSYKDGYLDSAVLSKRLDELVSKKDRETLEAEIDFTTNLVNDIKDPELFRKHIIASIFIARYDLAIPSLKKISKHYKGANELAAMVYYTIEKYPKALKIFKNIDKYIFPTTSTLMESLCSWHCGNKTILPHELRLEKILNISANANTFLGTLYYNEREYINAADYYVKAVLLSPKSEPKRLDALRASYQLNQNLSLRIKYHLDENEIKNQFSRFYHDTNSQLTPEEFMNEMNKKELDIFKINIVPFHVTAKDLLFYG